MCDRCVMTVTRIFNDLGLDLVDVGLGYAVITGDVTPEVLRRIDGELRNVGFELIEDDDISMVERVKIFLTRLARDGGGDNIKLSVAVAREFGDYKSVLRVFSTVEGRTMERYLITQRIEYVKELLDYGELTLSEIAWRTGFSSVAHLSRRFKDETGMTASEYKALAPGRRPLDKI